MAESSTLNINNFPKVMRVFIKKAQRQFELLVEELDSKVRTRVIHFLAAYGLSQLMQDRCSDINYPQNFDTDEISRDIFFLEITQKCEEVLADVIAGTNDPYSIGHAGSGRTTPLIAAQREYTADALGFKGSRLLTVVDEYPTWSDMAAKLNKAGYDADVIDKFAREKVEGERLRKEAMAGLKVKV